jgi:hypothetical protein
MQIEFDTRKNGTTTYSWVGETAATVDETGWNYATGIYVVPPDAIKADWSSFYFSAINPSVNIIYDFVSFRKIPSSCHSLVMNPTFDDGTTSFYYAYDRASMKIRMESPGYGGSGYAALIYDRLSSSQSLKQILDSRCFYTNAQYTISAKFKLLNNTNLSSTINCDPNARIGATQCPSVRCKFVCCHSFNIIV